MSLARASSKSEAGWSSFRRWAQSSLYSSSSPGATVLRVEKRPKVWALPAERALPGPVRGQPFAEGEAKLPVRPQEVPEMFVAGWAGNSTNRGGFALESGQIVAMGESLLNQ